jgi:predicted Zn-dependent protease
MRTRMGVDSGLPDFRGNEGFWKAYPPFKKLGLSFVQLDNRQMDDAVSIWDDATDPRTVGVPFDGEGTPKRRLDLVTQGVSVGLAYDRRTAALAGTQSTGHGSGSAAGGPVPSNVFLGAGSATREELIGQVGRGLIVTDFNYTRILDPKTQVVTGLTRNGTFLVENGQPVQYGERLFAIRTS